MKKLKFEHGECIFSIIALLGVVLLFGTFVLQNINFGLTLGAVAMVVIGIATAAFFRYAKAR